MIFYGCINLGQWLSPGGVSGGVSGKCWRINQHKAVGGGGGTGGGGEVACICHRMPSCGILTQTNDQVACGDGECAFLPICLFNAATCR